jgi:hypothetical protein
MFRVQKYDFLAINAKKGIIYLQVTHKVSNFATHLARAIEW